MMEGVVTRAWDFAMRVERGGTFFISGPASRTNVWTGFVCSVDSGIVAGGYLVPRMVEEQDGRDCRNRE